MRSQHPELASPLKRCLGALATVSWPWVPACGSLEPPRQDGENAQKMGGNGGKMGEIRSKTCKGVGITWATAFLRPVVAVQRCCAVVLASERLAACAGTARRRTCGAWACCCTRCWWGACPSPPPTPRLPSDASSPARPTSPPAFPSLVRLNRRDLKVFVEAVSLLKWAAVQVWS